MKKSVAISIQLVILTVLAVMGIIYILQKPPVQEVENYKKEEMPKPYVRKSDRSFFSSSKSTPEEMDSVSLTGQSGKYDEVRIGKDYEE